MSTTGPTTDCVFCRRAITDIEYRTVTRTETVDLLRFDSKWARQYIHEGCLDAYIASRSVAAGVSG